MLILFESGESRSFTLFSFSKSLDVPLGELDHRLEIAIVDDRRVSGLRIYHDFVMDIFRVRLSINLFPIPMGKVSVIVGMDWMSQFDL